MKRTVLLAVVLAIATGCRPPIQSNTTTPQLGQPTAEQPDQNTTIDAQGNRWSTYHSEEWGIQLAVPNSEACVQDTRDNVGYLNCDYGDIIIEVFAVGGNLSLQELREIAASNADLPGEYWEWGEIQSDIRGYSVLQAWTGANDQYGMVGIIGLSSVTSISHIVYIFGTNAAFESYREQLISFVQQIYAI